MNSLSAIGNISANAEVKYLANGDPLLSFNFALNSGFGEKQVTTWLRCSLFGKRATILESMLLKGTKIGITGEITNRKWVDKDGTEKYSLECRVNDLTLLGKKEVTENTVNQGSKSYANDRDEESIIPF